MVETVVGGGEDEAVMVRSIESAVVAGREDVVGAREAISVGAPLEEGRLEEVIGTRLGILVEEVMGGLSELAPDWE